MSFLSRRTILLLCLIACVACEKAWEQPRRRPFPVLDPRLAFPEYGAERPPDAGGAAGAEACGEAARPGKTLRLGAHLLAEIPQDTAWQAAISEGVTIIVQEADGRPNVWILTKEFQSLGGFLRLRRFQSLVDPGLTGRPLSAVLRNGDETKKRKGYRSRRGTFSGWKWVGPCARNPDLPWFRLGRTQGEWNRPQADAATPAHMIIGTASLSAASGLHLAIVYPVAEGERVAPELARFLISLRRTQEDKPRRNDDEGFSRLEEMIGLDLSERPAGAEDASAEGG